MAMGRRQFFDIVTLCFFIAATTSLLARVDSSAAFERPIHLSILTLLLTGAALSVLAKREHAELPSAIRLAAAPDPSSLRTATSNGLNGLSKASWELLRRVRLPPAPLALLVFCTVGRVLLFWRTIRTIQCSVDGLYALLPFMLATADTLRLRPASHGLETFTRHGRAATTAARAPAVRYVVVAAAWSFSGLLLSLAPGRSTGTICPSGWRWEPLIPLAQIVMLLLDTVALHCVSSLWEQHEGPGHASAVLSSALLSSAGVLVVLAGFSFYSVGNISWSLRIHTVGARDLLLDSMLASGAILAGIYLLVSLHPATLAVIFSAAGVAVQDCTHLFDPTGGFESSGSWFPRVLAVVCVGVLLNLDKDMAPSTRLMGENSHYHRAFTRVLCISVGLIFFVYMAMASQPDTRSPVGEVIGNLSESLRRGSDAWISSATQSRTLDEAVAEYKKRYGIPPPPHFDKWYEFAVRVNSTIIDNFDQIDSDTRAFWGLPPSVIRKRAAHLLEYPWLSVGGMRIRNKSIELSPHTPGTHVWMMESNRLMIQPFVQWLPDMDLAFNLFDECRVAVPWDEMRSTQQVAREARARLEKAGPASLHGFPGVASAPSSHSARLPKIWNTQDKTAKSPYFTNNIRRQIYYDVVAPTCPPQSRARQAVWWNRKTVCSACTADHSITTPDARVLWNWNAAGDLCHQPDLAYLHGFLAAPAPMISTDMLFPLFSQSRAGGFSDVLVPSPWNFYDKTTYDASSDMSWEAKNNTLFWRGSPSDGFAIHGSWEGFLRARFVYAARRATSGKSTPGWMAHDQAQQKHRSRHDPLHVNVSFVGELQKCSEADCPAETDTFYADSAGKPPSPVPFSDHWAARHLIDMDGAGFSGRFLPFLHSRSLVYRAALFRTWFDERVHPWRHYVPLDVRLGRGLWAVVDFFASRRQGGGDELAQRIAQEGREWAGRVLRKEDMQVYMFRLLLEWGRVVDDGRERMGWQESDRGRD